jgi:2-isopropylmalate synthase
VFSAEGNEVTGEAQGNGPVDATLNAIEAQVGSGSELLLYSVNAITTGTQAQGEVAVRLSKGGRIVNGVGTDPDIVAASAKAYISALNKLYAGVEKVNPQR